MGLCEDVKILSAELGFDLVAVSPAKPSEEDQLRYQKWCQKGYAGELSYMTRLFPRRWIPQDVFPEARSVITFGVNFFSEPKKIESKRGYGRVSRYAWGKDYHEVIKKRLEKFVKLLKENIGSDLKTKILIDSSPFLERAFACHGGLGFFGKNSLVINRQFGSSFFLSEILTNIEYETDCLEFAPPKNRKDDCGSCRRCLDLCPTGALVEEKILDARRCISCWTIESRGEIPEEIRPRIDDWIFGCDRCQEVCPYFSVSKQTQWEEFLPESGVGHYLSLLEVLSIKTDEKFNKNFEGTPLRRTKRAGLIRNACMVCVNQKFVEAIPVLEKCVKKDPEEMVRRSALWAIRQLKK